jgi:hypothetical protein
MPNIEDGRHHLWGSRRTWEDNIESDLKIYCKDVDWIHLTSDSLQWRDFVNTVMNLL